MTAPWSHVWTQLAHKPEPSARPIEVATAIVLVLLAVVVRWTPSRVSSTSNNSALHETAIASTRWAADIRRPTFRQLLGAVLTGCAIGLFVGGPGGALVGLASTVGVLIFSSRRVSESEMRSQLRLVAAAPPVVDLFAAGLAAGLLPADAAAVAATAFIGRLNGATREPGGHGQINAEHPAPRGRRFALIRSHRSGTALKPIGFGPRLGAESTHTVEPTAEIAQRFAAAAQALRRGVEPETAWSPLAVDGATAPVAAAALRASRTGAPAAETVSKAARDLWRAADQAMQTRVRSVAVRATVPLAVCFLPAFILVGVMPTALGLLAALRP
jgi:hypothetical protein